MACTPQTNTTLAEIAQLICESDNFVLSGHINPDGDCLGSELALMHALHALGKQATCVFANDFKLPLGLSWLPGLQNMVPAHEYSEAPDVFIACDVPTLERLGASADIHARAKLHITIDHHAVDTTMAQYTYVDPDASATALLVWELIGLLPLTPSLNMARCAYTGLMTDTGRFQFQNTTRECFEAAADMMSYGLRPDDVAREVFQNNSLASFLLAERMIAHAEIDEKTGLAISYITHDDLDNCLATKADADMLIDMLRSIAGVRVAALLREAEGEVRASLRAKDATNVAQVARQFGGGGHVAAAGLSYAGTLESARHDIKQALLSAMNSKEG